MSVDDLIDQLAGLSLRAGRASLEGTSKKLEYKDKGDHAVKQLEAHLGRVRLGISEGVAQKTLREAAKQEGKGLLRIAQAGLRNTAGGLEPLRLAYKASRTLLPLSPFIVATDLTMERLWYKVASRSVELGDFALGLRASACLQMCLGRRNGDDLAKGIRSGADCALVLVSDGEEDDLRLRSFAPPGVTPPMALAKLVSGAGLNACRCCLEVGSREALTLMTEELSLSAGLWIDRVSELGDGATADSYRALLFKQLWLGCAALEEPSLAAKSRECLVGRQTALGVMLRKEASWSVDVFVAHALRAAMALQERAGSGEGADAEDAAELSAFCLDGLCDREGEGWPVGFEGDCEEAGGLHPSWVEWLQYSAGLHQKVGQAAEAQRLLQLAYEYVQRCRKLRRPKAGRDHKVAECAAYAGILKMHTAAMITSLHPPDGTASMTASAQHKGKQGTNKRAGKRQAESPKPASAVISLTSRGLDYAGDVIAALESLAANTNEPGAAGGTESAMFVGAAVKAWTRAKKSCSVTALWMEREGASGAAENPGELEESEWPALSVRGRLVLAELSSKLALVRERNELGRALERIPPTASLLQVAVDAYLRVAHAHLGSLGSMTNAGPASGTNTGRNQSRWATAEDNARQALAAAAQVLEMGGDAIPSQFMKRVGTGFFGLGTSLLDHGEMNAGLEALVQGCRLLEIWTEVESDRRGTADGDDDDSSAAGVSEILRSAQLDMRLAKLSLVLQDSAECALAAAAAVRGLAFCPGMWCFSSEGQPEYPAGALTLVERFVACKLGCGGSANSKPSSTTERLAGASATLLSSYLSDSDGVNASVGNNCSGADDLQNVLEKRGFPSAAIVWVLLAACRAYRAYLPLCISEEAGPVSGEGKAEGGTLACVEGHRLATQAILEICRRIPRDNEEDGMGNGEGKTDVWEAHAWLLAATFEHDLHLADISDTRAFDNTAGVLTDLPAGIQHATSGATTASRLCGEGNISSPLVAAAAGGVFACIRAMLLRAVTDHDGDVKNAMGRGLDLFLEAARDSDWTPGFHSPDNLGPNGVGSIVGHLDVLEAHYALHGDTWQRVKVAEVRLGLADRARSEFEEGSLPHGAVSLAAASDCVNAASEAEGLPCLGFVYSAAVNAVCGLAVPERRGLGAVADKRTNGAASSALVEAAQVAVDVVRGVCLAEQSGGEDEGESVLLEARKALCHPESSAIAPVTAAYLECVAGLGLSWIYQRSGRLMEAMREVRQVMRLCRTWASAGGPLAVSDKQAVTLSAEKGDCIHDDPAGGLAAAVSQPQVEEGVGAEGGDIEDTMGKDGAECGRGREISALGSRWIPVYLEGLIRMGRLWRERGIASKASLTLRQGCVLGESLHAARFLRDCLLEEVNVATEKHQFARADRLLRASQDLLHQERRELVSAGAYEVSGECADCQVLDSANVAGSGAAPAQVARGKGSKRGAKKVAGKKKTTSASPTVAAESTTAACIRCRELDVNAAELTVVEASLLRKQGEFVGALAVCERGQAILARLGDAGAAGDPVSSGNGRFKGAEGKGYNRRAAEVLAMLRLQQGRVCCLLGNTNTGEELFRECSNADGAPALVRATALYRMGRMSLDVGDAAKAKLPLETAEALSRGAGVPKLVRKVRRVLAVTLAELVGQGRAGNVSVDGTWRVAALSSLSIGVTSCNQVTHASARRARKGEFESSLSGGSAGLRLFDVVSGGSGVTVDGFGQKEECFRSGSEDVCGEGCLKNAIASDLRTEWPIVSVCLAPGEGACKHLLVSRLVRGRPPLTLSVPLLPGDTHLLDRWREIMEENRDTLRGHSAEEAAEFGSQQKARWWERRVAVDEMVGDFLRELEERWFEANGLAAVLLGDVVGEKLGLELESVLKFAEDRIREARVGTSAVKGGNGISRGKGGKRPRKPATAEDVSGEVEQARLGGLSELVRVCVRGGEAMSESAWLKVVRLALSGAESDAAAAQVSLEIQEKVRAAFALEEAEAARNRRTSRPASVVTGRDPLLSPDIEKGRSSTSSAKHGGVTQAVAARSAALVSSVDVGAMSKMKVADLRRELSARGISTTGLKLKSDLLAKLVEAVRKEADGHAGGGRLGNKGGCIASSVDESEAGGDGSAAPGSSTSDELGAATTKANGRTKSSPQTAWRVATGGTSCNVGGTESGVGAGGRSGFGVERHPVVLVLDEQLQAIPWEGLPCLRGHAATRVPAVPFVFAALATRWDGGTDGEESPCETSTSRRGKPSPVRNLEKPWIPSQEGVRSGRGYYVLDPEANLPHTRKQLGPVFQGLGRRLGWSGVKGKAPTEEVMVQSLEEVDIFAYCGHGAGELLVGREAVAGLTKCAVAVLMGCSSGRLKGYGDFEPMGMATSYLAGGSPAVVANLWDVTDKDIDRFSVALFEAFLGEGGAREGDRKRALTLAHAVAESRSACKMPFVIGYAPVCYGIPVEVATSPLTR